MPLEPHVRYLSSRRQGSDEPLVLVVGEILDLQLVHDERVGRAANSSSVRSRGKDVPIASRSARPADHGVAVPLELGDRTVGRQVLPHADDEVGARRRGQLLRRVERGPAAPALHPSDGRLRRAHPLGHLRLGQPRVGPETKHQPHLAALVLVGAQAVYLRSEGRLIGYQAFTTVADVLTSEPGIWEARFARVGFDDEVVVPVDLIVPERLAPTSGRRSARLPREHGKSSARKSFGLEGAVVDHDSFEILALEADDIRRVTVNVAGVGALFVSKAHKLGERLTTPQRLEVKDAGDVYRLFDTASTEEMADLLGQLLDDDRSANATELALGYARQLFLTPGSVGVQLAPWPA